MRPSHQRYDGRTVLVASTLLIGIVLLSWGSFGGNRAAFWAGLLLILAGVLQGVVRISIHGDDD